MRVTRILSSVSWTHAIGEVLLIVIGITIALAVNSWWEDRQDRRAEALILGQLRAALQADLEDLESGLEWARGNERQLAQLLGQLRGRERLGSEIGPALGAVSEWITVNTRRRTGAYEELKNEGFSLISDETIRTEIVDVYEIHLASLGLINDIDEQFSLEQVAPYFYERFYRNEADEWVPVDGYELLGDDVYLINLVTAKQRRLQNWIIPAFESAVAAVDGLISAMNRQAD